MTTTDVALKCVIDIVDVSANIMRARIVMMVRVATELITFSPSQLLSLFYSYRSKLWEKMWYEDEDCNSVRVYKLGSFYYHFACWFPCRVPCQFQCQYLFHSISMSILMPISYRIRPRLIVESSSYHYQLSMLPLTCLLKNKTKVSML